MGRFATKYSPDQKQAFYAAILDDGLSYKVARERAAAGELRHEGQPVDPFEMPLATARDYVRDERRRREGKIRSPLTRMTPDEANRNLWERVASIADKQLKEQERNLAFNKSDPAKLQAALKVVDQAVRLGKAVSNRPTGAHAAATATKEHSEFATDLERRHRQAVRGTVNGAGAHSKAETSSTLGRLESARERLRAETPEQPEEPEAA